MQLMLFLCSISLGLLCLIWTLSGQLLQPFYNNLIQDHLESQLSEIIALMDNTTASGVLISTRTDDTILVNNAFQAAFYDAVQSEQINLSDLCVNVADTSLSYVLYSENVYPCLLHGGSSTLFGEDETVAQNRDTDIAVALREECFATGSVSTIVTSGEWQQMLVGEVTADGQYVVFVSASLSQVTDASIVLHNIAPFIAVIVLSLSVVAAWLFSLWFTRPISILSKASHVMASGDYAVQVSTNRTDELGDLTHEFNQMAKAVHRSAQLQTDLLANVSHDLRTPLTLIRGYAETLRDITGAKKEKRTEQLNIIIDESNRLTALVNSILELSKVSAGLENYAPTTFDVLDFCESIAERYQGVCTQNGWHLVLDLPTVPLAIYADRNMLERAVDNLLSNAMHHLGEDYTFILRAYETHPGHCRIEVEDHGKGIDPEEQAILFERYYRSRTSAGKTGTGLGLSIARAIFHQHGFAFGVDSTPHVRTTFWFVTTANGAKHRKRKDER